MPAELLARFAEFAVRTAILVSLLWVVNKLQKLNQRFKYPFLKLMGAAALASGLDMVPYVGHFLAVPVLLVCVKKVTRVDYVEALLAVAIAYALVIGLNLFLLGSFLSNLHVRIDKALEFETITLRHRIKAAPPAVVPTNAPVLNTNPPIVSVPASPAKPVPAKPVQEKLVEPATPKPAPAPIPMTNPPAQSPPTNLVAQPARAKPAENRSKYFSVKGVTRNGANSAVTIQSGTKTYTVFLEEAALMQTVDGPISVRFAELGENTVTLEINGESAKFPIPRQ